MHDGADGRQSQERELLTEEVPWGVSEDSPMDEGSEVTAVPEGQLGERRAGEPSEALVDHYGELPPLEPTPTPEAGPSGPREPAPPRRPFPDIELAPGDIIDRS